MSLEAACPQCGRRYQVNASLAGKRVKCRSCGGVIEISKVKVEGVDEEGGEGEAYALVEQPMAESTSERPRIETLQLKSRSGGESTFRATPTRAEAERRTIPRREETPVDAGFYLERLAFLKDRRLWWGIGGAFGLLLAVALMFPDSVSVVETILTVVGIVLALGGYGILIYAAFQEDPLHGFLMLIPLYAGYYVVSRWESTWPWLAMTCAGVGLLTVTQWLFAKEPVETPTGDEDGPAAVRVLDPEMEGLSVGFACLWDRQVELAPRSFAKRGV